MLNCVDMSRWGGELTRDEASCLWGQGIRHLIVGCGHPNGAGTWALQQASMWLEVNPGATFDAYIYLYMAGSAAQQTRDAIRTLAALPPRMWWLDAEDVDSPGLTPGQREDFLNECLTVLGSRTAGIYTARWWWPSNMANSQAFSHLPLWNSYYDGEPDTDGLPYGGWTESAIEQYQGTTNLCGQSVDLNYAKNLEDTVDQSQFDTMADDYFARRLPNWLSLAGDERPDKFSDRPDIPMTFPYVPPHYHRYEIGDMSTDEPIPYAAEEATP